MSRWDNDKERTNALADHLVRLMIVTKTPPDDYSLDALVDLEESPSPLMMRVESKRGGWEASHASDG